MRFLICLLLGCCAILLSGCVESEIKKVEDPPHIRYRIVEIEGKKWIATYTHGGHWSLAGPLE